jgi:hypothetical protein
MWQQTNAKLVLFKPDYDEEESEDVDYTEDASIDEVSE